MKKIISIFSLVFFGLYFSAMAEFVQPGDTTKMCTVDVLGVTSASESAPVTKIKALWCPEPTTPEHATTCVLDTSVPGTCSYTTNCELGYQPTGADRVDGQNGYKSTPSADNPSTAVCPSCEAKQITCSAGKYLPANSETCATCTKGYACPGGTFTYTGAEQGRSICSAGKYSAAGASSCSSCQAGTYSASPGAESCSPCAAGAYSASTGATSCTLCPGGTFAGSQGATKCTLCSAGTTSADGASSCSDCDNKNTGVDAWVAPALSSSTWTTKPTVNNICTISMCKTGNGYVATNQENLITGKQTGKIIDADTGVIKSNTSYAVSDAMQLSAGTYVFKQTNSNTGASMPLTIYKFASSSATTGTSAILKKAINKDVLEYHFKLTETSWVRISWRDASASDYSLTKDYTNECNPCTAGNYCRGGTNPSKVCPIGSYSGAKASTCTECANDKTTDHEGATTINDCQLCSNSTGASTWADNNFDETTGTMSNVCSVTSCEATYSYGATAGGTCTQCTDGYYCRGGTEPAKQCPLGSYNSTGAVEHCSFCPLGTTTTSPGASASSQCTACPNAVGIATTPSTAWHAMDFNSDYSFVSYKCTIDSCASGYAYISTANTAGYIEITPSDTTTYPATLTGWKAFTLDGSKTWSTGEYLSYTYDVAISEIATGQPVSVYNENYTTATDLPANSLAARSGKVIQGNGYIGFGTRNEYTTANWKTYLNTHPHTVLAPLATSDGSEWHAVKRASDGMFGYYCTSGAQLGTFVGAKGMTGTETSTRHWLDSESAYQNACSVCPAGQFCSGGKTVGTQCSIGQYSQAGASTCTPCAIGSYTDATGQAKCTVCTAGETTSVAGKGNCDVKCANNNGFVNSWSSATWKVTPSTSSINTTNSVSSSCKITNCSAGAYYTSTNSGNTNTCTACPAGSYKDATAGHTDTACSLCGMGTTSSMGATALSQCTACPNSAGVPTGAWVLPSWNETTKTVDNKCSLTGCSPTYKYNNKMLPDGYTQLEYIGTTGTQYIDTELILNQDAKIESKWQASSTSSNWVYGAGASNPRITVYRSGAGNLRWGNATVSVAGNITNTVEMVQDKTGVLFNGKFYPYSSSSSFTTSVSLTLFKANGSSSEFFSGKMYYVKIYDNGRLVRNFIPAKQGNAVGMYDIVEGKFYENKGTGSFTAPTTTVPQGASSDYQNICSVCVGGNYCPGGTGNAAKQEECAVGSWSDNGASTCETCTPGKTTRGTGTAGTSESACEIDCPGANDAHFPNQTSDWLSVSWNTNNTVTNLCKFANCNRGYSVEEGTYTSSFPTGSADQCNANTITLNYDVNGGNAIDSGACVYDGSINFPSAPVHPSGWEFNGWVFTGTSSN